MQQGGTQYFDGFGLVRSEGVVQGETPIARFERFTGGLPAQMDNAMVSWRLRGETDSAGRRWLHIAIEASPVLMCQRCMQPFAYPVQTENTLQVMKSDAELEALEAREEDQDEFTERVVGSQRMDILGLVEDELILALPYVPKHDVCPSLPEALADSDSDDARPSPFAVLGKLKKD